MNRTKNCRVAQQVIRHIYIHIPFCLQKCHYCSFHSQKYSAVHLQEYLLALWQEITAYQEIFQFQASTIYLGGGTPSLLSVAEISQILQQFEPSESAEITLEANPSTITPQFAADLKKSAVNRISLGIQSWDDRELKMLGRSHQAATAQRAIEILRRAGFDNISLDLIYGLPQQSKTTLQNSLQKMIDLRPEHISTYCLSLEPDVPLFARKSEIPPDAEVADFYQMIRAELLGAGYQHYEISNFSLPGFGSQHNSAYWQDLEYVGLGASAAGYLQGKRYQNNLLPAYLSDSKAAQIMPNAEQLSETDLKKEFIFLALRTASGLDLSKYQQRFGSDFRAEYADILAKYRDYLVETDKHVALQPAVYFVSNTILSAFM
ncbi:MAG: radical SAM family heme chaperone HemW [Candidatus Cloacimonadales bacterium]